MLGLLVNDSSHTDSDLEESEVSESPSVPRDNAGETPEPEEPEEPEGPEEARAEPKMPPKLPVVIKPLSKVDEFKGDATELEDFIDSVEAHIIGRNLPFLYG